MQWCVQLNSGKVCVACQRSVRKSQLEGIAACSVRVQGIAYYIILLFLIFKLESVF